MLESYFQINFDQQYKNCYNGFPLLVKDGAKELANNGVKLHEKMPALIDEPQSASQILNPSMIGLRPGGKQDLSHLKEFKRFVSQD